MNLKSLMLGLLFVLLWSSAFTSAKILVTNGPPFLVLGLRFFLTGIFGILLSILFLNKIKITREDWFLILSFGICQNTIYLGLNFYAMSEIDAYLAVIVASLLPVFVTLITYVMKLEKIQFLSIFGIITGFIGCWIILSPKINIGFDFYGIILCLIAVIALAIGTLIIKNGVSKEEQILPIVSIQMLVGGLPLFILSFFFENWIINFSSTFIIAFFYTCFFPGLLATIIWFKIVKKIGAIMASSFHFLNPPTGVLLAYFILNEKIQRIDIFGILIISISLLIIQQANRNRIN